MWGEEKNYMRDFLKRSMSWFFSRWKFECKFKMKILEKMRRWKEAMRVRAPMKLFYSETSFITWIWKTYFSYFVFLIRVFDKTNQKIWHSFIFPWKKFNESYFCTFQYPSKSTPVMFSSSTLVSFSRSIEPCSISTSFL